MVSDTACRSVNFLLLLGGSGIYEVGDNMIVEVKPHALLGFVGGADVMYQASDVVGLSAGLSFVQAGCKFKDNKGRTMCFMIVICE